MQGRREGFSLQFVELVGRGFVLFVFKQGGRKLPADGGGIGLLGDKATVMADGFSGAPFGLGKQAFGIACHGTVVFGPLFVNGQNGFDAGNVVGDDGGIHGACQ